MELLVQYGAVVDLPMNVRYSTTQLINTMYNSYKQFSVELDVATVI